MTEVALQELIVTGASFKTTALLPCEAPNPEPEITTCAPTGPVVVDRLVITGGVTLLDVIDTLSKYSVAGLFAWPPPTASPIYTFCAMLMSKRLPKGVQSKPSGE